MNTLLDVALSYDGYTHLRLEMTTGHLNFIYKDLVMSDFEVHYTLDAIMEEWEYPELVGPIQIFRQKNGVLEQCDLKVYSPD